MQRVRTAPSRGFAIAYVVIILAVLFLLSFMLVQMMTHEATYSFKHLEKTVAQFAAECGVEHAIYVLRQHATSDYKTLGLEKSSLIINEKFATLDDFTMDIPVNCSDDSRFAKLAAVDINQSLAELKDKHKLDATPKIETLKIAYKTLDTIDSSADRLLKFGKLSITCTGSYGTSKVTVDSERRVEIYRTMMVAPEWQFAVTADSRQRLPARRTTSGLFGMGTNYIAQYLIVNNGWRTQADPKTAPAVPAKIYGKDLMVELNDYTPNPYALGIIPVPGVLPAGGFLGALSSEGCDMIFKLGNKNVDPKCSPDHDSDSELVKYRAVKVGGINLSSIIDTKGGSLMEWDLDKTSGFLTSLYKTVFEESGKGGTRGAIDFTGIPGNPGEPLATDPFTAIVGFFSKLFGARDNYTHNEICGQVKRKYGYHTKSTAESWASWLTLGLFDKIKNLFSNTPSIKDTETYVFNMSAATPAAETFKPYAADVYRRMAGHGNGRLYVTAKDFADHKLAAGNLLWWKDISARDFNNVCWFFGYADSYEAMDETGWSWLHWWPDRNAFEATRLDSRHALQVNGVHFVDGNAFVEGYYKGRGAIVATGNIIVGGSIMRHPDDGTFDAAVASWLGEGTNNMLQLVALGTKAPDGDKPTGKIIIAPHKYPSEMFEGGMVFGGGLFKDSNDDQIKIDACLWAKNGITVSTEARDDKDYWSVWGEKDTFLAINGNLITERTCSEGGDIEKAPFETWPDKIMINRFERWIELLGMMKTENQVVVNLFPQPDRYRVYVEGEPGAAPPPGGGTD